MRDPSDLMENRTQIARAFVDARRAGHALPDYPGDVPTTLTEAYAVQDSALAMDGGTVQGWKVGRINPPVESVDRLSGPIFADHVVIAEEDTNGTDAQAMPVFAGGFAAAEAEFCLRIGTAPDPAKRSYTMAEALAHLDAVHVGIEIASSPFPGINDLGPRVTISDFGNNEGLLVGAALAGWQDRDLNAIPVELWINGDRIGAATAATMLDGPIGAARFLFEHLAERGIPLSAGQWISSGAVTGVHPVAIGDRVEARFDGQYSVHCTIEAR